MKLKQNLVIEHRILGKLADGALDERNEYVLTKLLPEHFYQRLHQDAFKLVQERYLNQKPFDALTLEGVVDASDTDLKFFFNDLVKCMYDELYFFSEEEVNKLIEIYDYNKALIKLHKAMQLSDKQEGTSDNLKIIKGMLYDIISEDDTNQKVGSRLTDIVDVYHYCDTKADLLKTGITQLDNYLAGGFERGTVLSLVAEPGVGKTYYGMYLVDEILKANPDTQGLFFSIEMTKKNLYKRFISLKAKKFEKLCSQKERDEAGIQLKLTNLNVYDSQDDLNCANIDFIRMTSILESKKTPVSVVLIDYLSIVQINTKAERDDLRINETMRLITNLAMQLNCLIIVAVHANRNPQTRTPFDRAPTQYDEGSSNASFKSSSYWFGLDKPERHAPNNKKIRGMFVIRAAKVRNEAAFYVNTFFQNGTFSENYFPYDPDQFVSEKKEYLE